MWKQVLEALKQIVTLSHETQKNKSDIKDLHERMRDVSQEVKQLRDEVQDATKAIERLAYEIHRIRENDSHEREKMALRLEVQLLRFERRLPAAKHDDGQDADPLS